MHTKQDEVQLRNSLRERWGADFRSTTDVASIVSFERSIDADRKSGVSVRAMIRSAGAEARVTQSSAKPVVADLR
jgi:hypothetical protein